MKKQKPLYIIMAAFGGWTAQYAEEVKGNGTTIRSSITGYDKAINTVIKNHPEFVGVPVFDFSPLSLPPEQAPIGFRTYAEAHELFNSFRDSIGAIDSRGEYL